MQEFEDYLTSKKIDAKYFKEEDSGLWEAWLNLFSQVSTTSFTQQKLFLINKIRRKFPLKEVEGSEQGQNTTAAPPKPKPKFNIPKRT